MQSKTIKCLRPFALQSIEFCIEFANRLITADTCSEMILLVLLSTVAVGCLARPSDVLPQNFGSIPQNVVTVRPNCPDGQEWVDGQCRDVWKIDNSIPLNVVTVSPNCPDGQQLVNGVCRDVWIKNKLKSIDLEGLNAVTVPQNCKENQSLINGVCVDIWTLGVLGDRNVITLPGNCRPGQVLINGACRDVWRQFDPEATNLLANLIRNLYTTNSGNQQSVEPDQIYSKMEFNNKNLITVPNQCPTGYKPDALGICREIF